MTIATLGREDHAVLVRIWEDAVRATHHFLPDDEIDALRPLLLAEYFAAVDLHGVRNAEGIILGFSGVHEDKLEMLFVRPSAFGTGVGRALTEHAIARQGVTAVDVNEQNPQARAFYERMGFVVVDRSPCDAQGKPYPLLHMRLSAAHARD